MVTISLCMIVKNEEKTLARCLESVKDIVDEIIIVDTGSDDNTKAVAGKFDARIYDFEWVDDFSTARNYSFSKATMDFIFWLDADDVVLEEDRRMLKQLKQVMNLNIDIVMMKYNIGKDAQGNETFSFYRERLLKRSRDFRWYGQVHEYMVFDGIIIHTDITITHKKESEDSDRNLKILEKLASQGDEHLSPRDLFYLAKELFHNRRYEEAVRYYEKFLGTENAMPSFYFESCMDLSKYYMEKGEAKKALRVLIRSFEHDLPRAEVCCFIGAYYKENEDYKRAIFWYELALKLEKPKVSWEGIMHDCWGFLPCIELCLCFYKLGNMKDAIKYNVMAASYKPNDPIVMKNKEFFENSLRITVEEYTGYKDIPFSDIGCNTDLVVMKKEYENLSLQGNINKTI